MSERVQKIRLEGWLLKKKSKDNFGLFKSDNQRWFKIQEVQGADISEMALCYYHSPKDKEPKGWIYMKDITDIFDDKKNFTVVSASRTMTLEAQSSAEHALWLQALLHYCPNANCPSAKGGKNFAQNEAKGAKDDDSYHSLSRDFLKQHDAHSNGSLNTADSKQGNFDRSVSLFSRHAQGEKNSFYVANGASGSAGPNGRNQRDSFGNIRRTGSEEENYGDDIQEQPHDLLDDNVENYQQNNMNAARARGRSRDRAESQEQGTGSRQGSRQGSRSNSLEHATVNATKYNTNNNRGTANSRNYGDTMSNRLNKYISQENPYPTHHQNNYNSHLGGQDEDDYHGHHHEEEDNERYDATGPGATSAAAAAIENEVESMVLDEGNTARRGKKALPMPTSKPPPIHTAGNIRSFDSNTQDEGDDRGVTGSYDISYDDGEEEVSGPVVMPKTYRSIQDSYDADSPRHVRIRQPPSSNSNNASQQQPPLRRSINRGGNDDEDESNNSNNSNSNSNNNNAPSGRGSGFQRVAGSGRALPPPSTAPPRRARDALAEASANGNTASSSSSSGHGENTRRSIDDILFKRDRPGSNDTPPLIQQPHTTTAEPRDAHSSDEEFDIKAEFKRYRQNDSAENTPTVSKPPRPPGGSGGASSSANVAQPKTRTNNATGRMGTPPRAAGHPGNAIDQGFVTENWDEDSPPKKSRQQQQQQQAKTVGTSVQSDSNWLEENFDD